MSNWTATDLANYTRKWLKDEARARAKIKAKARKEKQQEVQKLVDMRKHIAHNP